jgi:hypothetical protein
MGSAEQMEGSAKSPPKGKVVRGIFYVAAEAATLKATEYVAASLRGSGPKFAIRFALA